MTTFETIVHEGQTYKKVERKAKEGDKILIVVAERTGGRYRNNDVFTVTDAPSMGVEVKEHDVWIVDREYVVLEPVSPAPITLISTSPAVEKTYTITLTDGVMEVNIAGLNRLPPHEIPDAVDSLEAIRKS
ncbi:hypothetical protein C4A76_10695 [Brevibacillus laterosporus]|uniref:hypothetical protein n=1 Tax=Brevibacillus laterosporus TaxID=1465 RepID=UPI000CE3700E|nr:hypothetical protein [Brevibacillus laterosporus]PPA87935.1 hypothetical protein C4A76_10695 [Brevibacillus laterosporus]